MGVEVDHRSVWGGEYSSRVVLGWLSPVQMARGSRAMSAHKGGGHCRASYKPGLAVTWGHFCPFPVAEAILGLPGLKAHILDRVGGKVTMWKSAWDGRQFPSLETTIQFITPPPRLMTQFSLINPLTVCLCFSS